MEIIISIVIGLIIIGCALWLIKLLPFDPLIMQLIQGVIIIGVVIWLLGLLIGYSTPIRLRY